MKMVIRKRTKGQSYNGACAVDELDDSDWRNTRTTGRGIGWCRCGYCKIAGMVDESMDPTVLNSQPQEWEYRSKPAWQRLFIITGVFEQFVAIIIYDAVFAWGKEYLPVENAYLGYNYCETALANGFQNGDVVVSVNGQKMVTERDIIDKIIIDGKCDVVVRRQGVEVPVTLPADFSEQIVAAQEKQFLMVRVPFVVETVSSGTPAADAKLQKGDSIIGVNGKQLAVLQDIKEELKQCADKKIAISYVRNHQVIDDSIYVNSDGIIGVLVRNPSAYFVTERQNYGFFASIPAGWSMGVETLIVISVNFALCSLKR